MSEKLTHWKRLINPDYLGAYSLEPGQELIVTIKEVRREMVTGVGGKKDECTIAYFTDHPKPMILNNTNQKAIQKAHDTPYIEHWVGRQIQLYAGTTKFQGEEVEALRIRPFAPKQKKKPLNQSSDGWAKALAAVGNGEITIERIIQLYDVPENCVALLQEAANA